MPTTDWDLFRTYLLTGVNSTSCLQLCMVHQNLVLLYIWLQSRSRSRSHCLYGLINISPCSSTVTRRTIRRYAMAVVWFLRLSNFKKIEYTGQTGGQTDGV